MTEQSLTLDEVLELTEHIDNWRYDNRSHIIGSVGNIGMALWQDEIKNFFIHDPKITYHVEAKLRDRNVAYYELFAESMNEVVRGSIGRAITSYKKAIDIADADKHRHLAEARWILNRLKSNERRQ